MLTLPQIPINPIQLTRVQKDQEPWISEIGSKRHELGICSNYTTFISNLESYLNFINSQVLSHEIINHYTELLKVGKSFALSQSIPWKLPITNKIKTTTKEQSFIWSLTDEVIIVLINISLSYNARGVEIIENVLSDKSLSEKESQQLWLNAFKLFKKSLEYINFLKSTNLDELNNSYFETSSNFINIVNSIIHSSIQLTFLTKAIWTLKSVEYDITASDTLNFSTLSRIAIYVKEQLKYITTTLKISDVTTWVKPLEGASKLVDSYVGTLLSIENYKQDKIGISIGFLNGAIESISFKNQLNNNDQENFEDEHKLKKKFSILKKKINTNNNKIKPKKIKLNVDVKQDLPNGALQLSIEQLFELIEVLNLKYNLENNNLKFDTVIQSKDLFQNYLPTGRAVPISDNNVLWRPNGWKDEKYQGQGQYY